MKMSKSPCEKFYNQWVSQKSKTLEVRLKNGSRMIGKFVSHYYTDETMDVPTIDRWHFVNDQCKSPVGIDAFGYLIGEIIFQKNIRSIKFLDSSFEIKF